jgi:hypothetical protein
MTTELRNAGNCSVESLGAVPTMSNKWMEGKNKLHKVLQIFLARTIVNDIWRQVFRS